ncbi:hypothetical protein Tco_0934653, partial [Tanacetum coccineum]
FIQIWKLKEVISFKELIELSSSGLEAKEPLGQGFKPLTQKEWLGSETTKIQVGNGTPINVSTPYSSNDSPILANHPPQTQYVAILSELVIQKKEEEKRIAEEQAAKDRYWKIPICYDDDEDDTIAITPVLPIKEPDNSLSMGDEHLDTIPATESDEVIKSSVENLIVVNFDDDNSSSDDDSPYGENIEYVDASPPDVCIVQLRVSDDDFTFHLLPHGPMNSGSSRACDSVNKNKALRGRHPCLSEGFPVTVKTLMLAVATSSSHPQLSHFGIQYPNLID